MRIRKIIKRAVAVILCLIMTFDGQMVSVWAGREFLDSEVVTDELPEERYKFIENVLMPEKEFGEEETLIEEITEPNTTEITNEEPEQPEEDESVEEEKLLGYTGTDVVTYDDIKLTSENYEKVIPRNSQPVLNEDQYYYSDLNVYWKQNDSTYYPVNYLEGNCTWYAYGRACEIAGKKLNIASMISDGSRMASVWYNHTEDGFVRNSSVPQLGAIACWAGNDVYSGHVAIVERIYDDGYVDLSESSYPNIYWKYKPHVLPQALVSNWQGYIYLEEVDPSTPTPSGTPYVISNGVLTKYNGDSETVNIPDGVTKIATGCFDEISKNKPEDVRIKYINFPNTLTEIEEGAFKYCRNLSSVNLPDSLKILHGKAFESCTINKLRIPAGLTVETNPIYEGQDWFSGPFYATSINQIEWASNINKIPDYLFSDSELIMDTLIIPDTVTEIGIMAFHAYNGTSMKRVILPSNLCQMGERAFYYCKRLESIEIPSKITTIPEQCFSFCGMKSLTIPSNVKTIEEDAFEYCELESILFPTSTITLHSRAFRSTKIQSFTLSDNILLELDSEGFATSPFYECELLKTINISTSCRTIPNCMFDSCESLETLTIPDQITTIGRRAFSGCKGLKTVIIGSGVTSIGDQAFSSCKQLESISFGENLTSIGEAAFAFCVSLKEIHLPNRVTSLGEGIFGDCEQLETAELGNSLKKLPEYAFQDCISLSFVDLPDTVTEIGAGAFNGCTSLTEVYYPANIKKIGSAAFARCTNLKRVVMQDSLEEIGDRCYTECSSLREVMFSNKLKTIPDYAFDECTSLQEIKIPDNIISIGSELGAGSVFGYCPNLKKITIPESVKNIAYSAFYNSDNCIIYGVSGSYAEKYAKDHSMKFVAVAGTKEITKISVSPSSNITLYEGEKREISFATDAGYIPEDNLVIQNGDSTTCTHLYKGNGIVSLEGEYAGDTTLIISINDIHAEVKVIVKKAMIQFRDQDGTDLGLDMLETQYGKNYLALPIPEKSGCEFAGWFTQKELRGSKITSESIFKGIDILYAGWIKNDEKIRILPQEEYVYDGAAIKPQPVVYSGTKQLTLGVDYTVTYQNNTNIGDEESNKPPTILIKGKGDYTKTTSFPFTILPKPLGDGYDFADDFTIAIADKQYNGKEQISKPTIKFGKMTLNENKDYTLSFEGDQVNPGEVTVIVNAKDGGNYTGSARVTYTIYEKGKGLSTAYVPAITNQTYTGDVISLDDVPVVVKEAKNSKTELVRGIDYDIVYANGTEKVNVGTANILIRGKGDYTGTKAVTFKIVPKKLTEDMISVSDAIYTGTQVKPSVSITNGDVTVDSAQYTVSYSNNTKAASAAAGKSAPKVTVKGKGNFTGTATANFTIEPMELSAAELDITVPNIKDNGKEIKNSAVKPTVKYVNSTTGKTVTLKNGTDYDVVFNRTNTCLQTVDINLKGNYQNNGNIKAEFMIFGKVSGLNLNDFNVTAEDENLIYSGAKITPQITVKTTVDDREYTLVQGKDYTVSYSNNINAADDASASRKPAWKVTGKGAYNGSISGNFTIMKRQFTSEDYTVTVADVKYNKKDQKPKVAVIDNNTGKALKSSDYTLRYDSTKGGVAENAIVTVTGKGNYEGTLTGSFRVYETAISSAVFESLAKESYTGKPIKPSGDKVRIFADNKKTIPLTENEDYVLSYGVNTKAGKGTVNVTGIGKYGGSKTLNFTILPKWLQWLL